MADWLSREQRSRNMSRIRSSGNKSTELAFVKIIRAAGISGWRRNIQLPGKPDFVFRSHHLAVFIDGCFWHGCPRCYRLPKDNRRYWQTKVMSNRRRDRRASRLLRSREWRVLRFWEHLLETEKGRARLLARLCRALSQ